MRRLLIQLLNKIHNYKLLTFSDNFIFNDHPYLEGNID
jgi:hypothetical protein